MSDPAARYHTPTPESFTARVRTNPALAVECVDALRFCRAVLHANHLALVSGRGAMEQLGTAVLGHRLALDRADNALAGAYGQPAPERAGTIAERIRAALEQAYIEIAYDAQHDPGTDIAALRDRLAGLITELGGTLPPIDAPAMLGKQAD